MLSHTFLPRVGSVATEATIPIHVDPFEPYPYTIVLLGFTGINLFYFLILVQIIDCRYKLKPPN